MAEQCHEIPQKQSPEWTGLVGKYARILIKTQLTTWNVRWHHELNL